MKNMVRILGVLLIIVVIQCSKKEEKEEVKSTLPVLTTSNVTEITRTTASSGGNVTSDGEAEITVRGVCWGTTTNPTISGSKTTDGVGKGSYTSSLTSLTSNTTYYVKAYAINSAGTAYGNEETFSTNQVGIITLNTTEVTSIEASSAISGGNITDDGGSTVLERGLCWSTEANPTTMDNRTSVEPGTGIFTGSIVGLVPCTTYYVRAFATSIAGTAYGNELTFISSVALPAVTTASVHSWTSTTAVSGGNVVSFGGCSVISSRGVCWSINTNPTISDSCIYDGSGTDTFISNLSDLEVNTTYYIRAFATNEAGTAYGNQQSITTITVDTTIFGKWIIAEGSYNGNNISNLTGYIIIVDGSYKANFSDGSNTGYAEARYTINEATIKSNLTGETLALNAGNVEITCCPEVQLWATVINCTSTIIIQWGGTAIGYNDPGYLIDNNQLVLRSSDGKTILRYDKE
jgi:hypothetical protein